MFSKIKENSIYVIFSVYLITILLQNTSTYALESVFEITIKVVRYLCYICFILKTFLDWKNGKNNINILIIFIGVLSLIVYYFSKDKNLLILTILLCALRNTDKEKLIEIGMKTYVIVFFSVIIGSLFNLIPDWIYIQRQTTARHSLGFIYPTITSAFYLTLTMMYIYTRKNKIKVYEIFILEMVNVFIYKYTDGRTSFLLTTIVLFIMLIKKIRIINIFLYSKFSKNILKGLCYILPALAMIFILVFTYLYSIDNSIANSANRILSNRLDLNAQAFNNYKITLFGQDISWKGWGGVGHDPDIDLENYTYNFVDNSYIRIIFDYGVIPSLLIILGYTIILIKNYKNNNYLSILILVIMLIMAEMEPCLIDFNSNIFLINFVPLIEYKPIKRLSYKNIIRKLKKET